MIPKISEVKPIGELAIPKFYQGAIGGILISEGEISARVKELAAEIYEFYQERPYTILVVLKGAINFYNLLYKELSSLYTTGQYSNFLNTEFIKISSYENDKSTGQVKIANLDLESLKGKEILIIEDILDTGQTLNAFIEHLNGVGIKAAKICTLIDKYKNRKAGLSIHVDFVGYTLEFTPFIIGCGMDYNEYFRDLNCICIISNEGINKFKV